MEKQNIFNNTKGGVLSLLLKSNLPSRMPIKVIEKTGIVVTTTVGEYVKSHIITPTEAKSLSFSYGSIGTAPISNCL